MEQNQTQQPILYYARLTPEHLARFAAFCCGDDKWDCDLNDFLRDDALREGDARLSVTYVFYDEHEQPVAYVALSTGQIQNQEASKKSPPLLHDAPYPSVSALRIGRLAVDHRHQGEGYGSIVLAWIRDMALSLPIGCRFLALHVDKENEAATRFYTKWGFFKPPYVMAHHSLQLMLYDLIGSQPALAEETNGPV